ncbi:Cytochrome P450 [Quillaja saponaria]|uniref:Cytochrome P450 n=1 Tax=Quillaja saponaria TaxID=32244 RepID=A0AAD7PB48_QUISA|nr:Cytochrome P450 [Quillaja saponaria]
MMKKECIKRILLMFFSGSNKVMTLRLQLQSKTSKLSFGSFTKSSGVGNVRIDEKPKSKGESTSRDKRSFQRTENNQRDWSREAFKGQKIIEETDLEKLHYLKSVIKETLRLHPPVPILVPRECRELCKINVYDIPKNTKVIVNAWAIGRDPSYWDNAECFVLERIDFSPLNFRGARFEYIPFGAGRRMCPGILYGQANIELPLAQLLYHFNWKLPNGMQPMDLDMIEVNSATVGRKNQLCLIATSHK